MKLGFGTTLATIAHLAAYGMLGGAVIGMLAVLAGLGLVLLPVGVGLAFVALLALALRGIQLIESWRVSSLFDTDLRSAPMHVSTRTDWMRGPMTLLLQFASPANWIAVAHGFITTMLGWVALGLISLTGWGVGMMFWPVLPMSIPGIETVDQVPHVAGIPINSLWFLLIGFVAILLGLVGLAALAIAHRAISVPLFAPNREQELRDAAQVEAVRRGDAIHAAEVERGRLERDLHDGVQPRLVSVGMTLGMAKAKLSTDPDAAAALIDEAHTSTKAAITELRQLARGFHPAVLEDRGLDAALSALANQSHLPIHLDVRVQGRPAPAIEAAMYFAIAESITNANKHAGATQVRVTVVSRPGGMLWGRIEDDGRGGARRTAGGGIDGVAGRVRAAGGNYTLSSPAGGPTTVEVSLPCAS